MAIGKLIPPLTLGTLCVVIYMLSLGDVDFYTKGQPREATVVWEIYHNGNWVFPMADDEGNDAGALAVGNNKMLPVLRGDK